MPWRERIWGHLKVCAPNNANSDKERTSDHATSLRRLLAAVSSGKSVNSIFFEKT